MPSFSAFQRSVFNNREGTPPSFSSPSTTSGYISIRAHLRSYDLIVRFGGDEFLCGLLDVSMADAAKRFSLVNADLATTQRASVTSGLAELEADDALEDLIARADEALYRERQRLRSTDA